MPIILSSRIYRRYLFPATVKRAVKDVHFALGTRERGSNDNMSPTLALQNNHVARLDPFSEAFLDAQEIALNRRIQLQLSQKSGKIDIFDASEGEVDIPRSSRLLERAALLRHFCDDVTSARSGTDRRGLGYKLRQV